MKKSLFRLTDMLELSVAYIFCFSLNLLLDYAKTLDMDAYILKAFSKNFIDYQPLIVSLFEIVVSKPPLGVRYSLGCVNRQPPFNGFLYAVIDV